MSRSGWFGQSYRHYLASKGVSTGRKKYMARDTPGEALFRGFFDKYDARRKKALTDTSFEERAKALETAYLNRPEKDVYGRSQFSPEDAARIAEFKRIAQQELTASSRADYLRSATVLDDYIKVAESAIKRNNDEKVELWKMKKELEAEEASAQSPEELRNIGVQSAKVESMIAANQSTLDKLNLERNRYVDLQRKFKQDMLTEPDKAMLRALLKREELKKAVVEQEYEKSEAIASTLPSEYEYYTPGPSPARSVKKAELVEPKVETVEIFPPKTLDVKASVVPSSSSRYLDLPLKGQGEGISVELKQNVKEKQLTLGKPKGLFSGEEK